MPNHNLALNRQLQHHLFVLNIALNRYDPYGYLRYGMCLDWLGRHDEAAAYYDRALSLDPNSYYMRAHMGWHYAQLGDWKNVKLWMERSLELKSDPGNVIAWAYHQMAFWKLAEEGAK